MGRHRKTNHHLPHRVYEHHGSYWYKPLNGPARKLARLEDHNPDAIQNHHIVIPEFSFDQHASELHRVARDEAPALASFLSI